MTDTVDKSLAWDTLVANTEKHIAFMKELSEALLKVRPLGGSELFVKRFGNYFADPVYCGQMIEEMRASLDQEIRARIRLERQLAALQSCPQETASE